MIFYLFYIIDEIHLFDTNESILIMDEKQEHNNFYNS